MSECSIPLGQWLTNRCEFLQHIEKEAASALHEDNNPDRYRQLMQQKALCLEALDDEAQPIVQTLPSDRQQEATRRLQRFSMSASKALELESVFYMSALLFPEDYKDGDPNDLERFRDEVVSWEK